MDRGSDCQLWREAQLVRQYLAWSARSAVHSRRAGRRRLPRPRRPPATSGGGKRTRPREGSTHTFLEENALQERVLVPQHQTLVRGIAVGGLEAVEVLLVHADRLLELLDVLGAAFAESSLGLAVPLLPLLRRCVYLPSALGSLPREATTRETPGGAVRMPGECGRRPPATTSASGAGEESLPACGRPCAWAAGSPGSRCWRGRARPRGWSRWTPRCRP